jgi:type I restriction enzyme, S subunit
VQTYGLRRDDIVVNRVNGSIDILGKASIVGHLDEPMVFESNMMRLTADRRRVLPRFLLQYLGSDKCRQQIREKARVIHQASINQQDLGSLWIAVPPLPEQHEIVRALESIEVKQRSEETRQAALGALFDPLLHQLMTGRLRVADVRLAESAGVA